MEDTAAKLHRADTRSSTPTLRLTLHSFAPTLRRFAVALPLSSSAQLVGHRPVALDLLCCPAVKHNDEPPVDEPKASLSRVSAGTRRTVLEPAAAITVPRPSHAERSRARMPLERRGLAAAMPGELARV